jgi:hypothetical protein
MKIDVLVTGQFPSNGNWRHLSDALYRISHHFGSSTKHDVITRYHTWNRASMRQILVPTNDVLSHAKQYTIYSEMPHTYNPYKPVPKFVDTPGWDIQLKKHAGKNTNIEKWPQPGHVTRALQQVSTCKLIKSIPESRKPDLFIRIRWDVLLSYNFDFEEYIQKAYNEDIVVGFHTRHDGGTDWSVTRKTMETGDYKIEEAVDSNPEWHQKIYDSVIMFKPESINTNIVDHWFNTKMLLPAEWGWWQCLCYSTKRPHMNIDGVAAVIRHMEGEAHVG